jgi:uncharacterized protein involved in outer membrane biogenesis
LQTTLLAVAIAIILALVAALVGPLFIDWGTYRTLFETEASRLTGLDVRVNGAIEARLLPSPRLTLHDVEIGQAGADNVRAKELNIELALGPLMRGRWQADDLYLAAPQFGLSLDTAGHLQAPKLAIKFNPDALTVDRLHFDGGTVTLTNAANGAGVTLTRVAFDGRANSLLGPFDGEGSATLGKEYYSVQLSAGRYSESDGLKLRLSVQPTDHPVSMQADGTLTFVGGKPHFDGSLSLQRPAGLARVAGQVNQPWQVRGHVEASGASALMKDFQFRYGSQAQGIKLAGVVQLSFDKQPRLKAELTGTEIDLAHAFNGDGNSSPGAALRQLAGLAAKAFRPPVPIQIGIGVEQVKLGGGTLQNLRGDIAADAAGWNLTDFEFRAPGFTDARLSGQLTVDDRGRVRFRGPAVIDANDPKALAAWLEGRTAPPEDALQPLHLQGNVTFSSEKIAVDDLTAGVAGKTITGHFAYDFAASGRPSKFDAALNAPELDLDAMLGFGQALFAGSGLERPHDMAMTADIGRASIAGIEGHDISARVKVNADRWQIDRLSVADLGGAAFSAEGGLVLKGPSPQGSITVDFNTPAMAPMMTLLQRFAPTTADALSARAWALAPAKLHAQLTLGGSVPAGEAKLGVNGNLGQVQVAMNGEGQVDTKAFRFGDLRLGGKLSADDGKALVTLLGLDPVIAVGKGRGELTLTAHGPARGKMRVDGRLSADGLAVRIDGSAQPFTDAPSAKLHARVTRADAAPLRGGGRDPLPVTFAGNLALSSKDVRVSDIDASIGATTLRGRLGMTFGALHRLDGELEADRVAAPGLIAAAIGMPTPPDSKGAAWAWSEDPFAAGAFGNFTGKIALRLRQVELMPRLNARRLHATLETGKDALTFDDMDGVLARGGRFSGSLAFQSGDDGLTAHGKIALTGIDAESLMRASARPPLTGTLDLSFDVEGVGLSPVALIGSLHGGGSIALRGAEIAGLNPRAFDAVTHAVDQGVAVDAHRISDVVSRALASGQLSLRKAQGAIAINAGQLRLRDTTADSADATLALSGNLDLIDGALDAHLVLSGKSEAGGVRPDIYMGLKGPFTAPTRSIDVSALSGWLTLRAIENQAKHVKELEEAARKRAEAERKREEAARKREEARRQREQAAREQSQAAQKPSVPSPSSQPLQIVPSQQIPALPAPVEITPLPPPTAAVPAGVPPPEASVGVQH